MNEAHGLQPDWPAPPRVRAFITTRAGGDSAGCYAGFNLGDHVGDDPATVAAHRARLAAHLAATPVWLDQVHGRTVVDAAIHVGGQPPRADAAYTRTPGVACTVLTADCLPLLLCDRAGSVVAAAHAGWRGLLGGVLEATLDAMAVPAHDVLLWLGPAIGPRAFEVGQEVVDAFVADEAGVAQGFVPAAAPGKWLGDLFTLARRRAQLRGVGWIGSSNLCTWSDAGRFYSYRRDGVTGRFASSVWLAPEVV